MRLPLVAVLLLAATVATASDDEFLKGEELQAEIAKSCGDGCITFNREEAEAFKEAMGKIVQRAFEAGMQQQKAACRSLL